jgi:esterase/lipase
MSILLIILIIVVLYIIIYIKLDTFILNPTKINKYKSNNILNIDNKHYAIFIKKNTDRILLLCGASKGNLDVYYEELSKYHYMYDYDILCIEYPGYGVIKRECSIDNCIKEIYFWIQYIKNLGYKTIDVGGYSIGGGIMIECLKKYNITYINNIYLVATFTSLVEVVYKKNYLLYLIHEIFLKKHNLDTYTNLKDIHCNKLYIIHSIEDNLIPFNMAQKNFLSECKNIKNKSFIIGKGKHSKIILDSNIKL